MVSSRYRRNNIENVAECIIPPSTIGSTIGIIHICKYATSRRRIGRSTCPLLHSIIKSSIFFFSYTLSFALFHLAVRFPVSYSFDILQRARIKNLLVILVLINLIFLFRFLSILSFKCFSCFLFIAPVINFHYTSCTFYSIFTFLINTLYFSVLFLF